MAYHSIVLVKQVPDTANVTAAAMKDDGTVNRAALPTIFNPEDLHALELALDLKDRFGGTVTTVSMGPPKAADVLRDTLYRGADRAILVTDRRAAASDTLATSYILSQACRTVGKFDFVFCGRQAIDGDTAQTGPQCAEKLGIPQIVYLEEVLDITDGVATLKRNVGNGYEVVRVRLPFLATVMETAGEPRPWNACRLMRYKHCRVESEVAAQLRSENSAGDDAALQTAAQQKMAELKSRNRLLEQWNLDNIHADLNRCGLAGSPTKVFRIQAIVLKKEGFSTVEPTQEGVSQLIHELVQDKTIG